MRRWADAASPTVKLGDPFCSERQNRVRCTLCIFLKALPWKVTLQHHYKCCACQEKSRPNVVYTEIASIGSFSTKPLLWRIESVEFLPLLTSFHFFDRLPGGRLEISGPAAVGPQTPSSQRATGECGRCAKGWLFRQHARRRHHWPRQGELNPPNYLKKREDKPWA